MFRRLLAAFAAFAIVFLASTGLASAQVDVNNADATQLQTIKGIGPAISAKIIAERKNGNFRDWSDLEKRVSGIGDKNSATFSQSGLTVGGAAKANAPMAAPAPTKETPSKTMARTVPPVAPVAATPATPAAPSATTKAPAPVAPVVPSTMTKPTAPMAAPSAMTKAAPPAAPAPPAPPVAAPGAMTKTAPPATATKAEATIPASTDKPTRASKKKKEKDDTTAAATDAVPKAKKTRAGKSDAADAKATPDTTMTK